MSTRRFQKAAIRNPQSTAQPRILMSRARVVYLGPGLNLSPHRNAAATLAIALDRRFEIAFPDREPNGLRTQHVCLIPSGTMHHLTAFGAMAFVYLDALSDDYETINPDTLESEHRRLSQRLYRVLTQSDTPPAAAVEMVFAMLGIEIPRYDGTRLAHTIRAIDRRPQAFHRIADAAQHAGLSVSRFQHVFRQETGMPFRRYRLWRRMAIVASALQAGRSLTEAAHDSGFSSSAHLSATFRSMFGITPSGLIATGTSFEIAPDEDPAVVALDNH